MKYYNGARTHLSLAKDAPVSRAVDRAGHIFVAQPWADCITNMPGFNLRQAQPTDAALLLRQGRYGLRVDGLGFVLLGERG
jgi:hypothetical protein